MLSCFSKKSNGRRKTNNSKKAKARAIDKTTQSKTLENNKSDDTTKARVSVTNQKAIIAKEGQEDSESGKLKATGNVRIIKEYQDKRQSVIGATSADDQVNAAVIDVAKNEPKGTMDRSQK